MLESSFLPVMTLRPGFLYNKAQERWELLEEGSKTEGGGESLELASFLFDGEISVGGNLMRSRALDMAGVTGQYHAERVLAQAERIPLEWRKFYLLFPGTLWRSPGGALSFPALRWFGGAWLLCFYRVAEEDDWRDHCRVVRLRKF